MDSSAAANGNDKLTESSSSIGEPDKRDPRNISDFNMISDSLELEVAVDSGTQNAVGKPRINVDMVGVNESDDIGSREEGKWRSNSEEERGEDDGGHLLPSNNDHHQQGRQQQQQQLKYNFLSAAVSSSLGNIDNSSIVFFDEPAPMTSQSHSRNSTSAATSKSNSRPVTSSGRVKSAWKQQREESLMASGLVPPDNVIITNDLMNAMNVGGNDPQDENINNNSSSISNNVNNNGSFALRMSATAGDDKRSSLSRRSSYQSQSNNAANSATSNNNSYSQSISMNTPSVNVNTPGVVNMNGSGRLSRRSSYQSQINNNNGNGNNPAAFPPPPGSNLSIHPSNSQIPVNSNSNRSILFPNAPPAYHPGGVNVINFGSRYDSAFFIQRMQSEDVVNESRSKANPKFVAQYLFGDVIGEGSYGKVKEAFDSETLQRVAIKIMKKNRLKKIPNGEENVRREISLLRRLKHRNVVQLLEVLYNDEKKKMYVVFEYCPFNLQAIIEKAPGKKLGQFQAKDYFKQLIEGLVYLHSKSVIHRDIKPQNLLVTVDGTLKISDFGVAEELDLYLEHDYCSSSVGSPAFQSPEVALGLDNFSGRKVDVWASGVTLYHMLTGKYPFEGENVYALFENIGKGQFEIPLDLIEILSGGGGNSNFEGADNGNNNNNSNFEYSSIKDLLMGMLKKDPEERYSTERILQHNWLSNSLLGHNTTNNSNSNNSSSNNNSHATSNNLVPLYNVFASTISINPEVMLTDTSLVPFLQSMYQEELDNYLVNNDLFNGENDDDDDGDEEEEVELDVAGAGAEREEDWEKRAKLNKINEINETRDNAILLNVNVNPNNNTTNVTSESSSPLAEEEEDDEDDEDDQIIAERKPHNADDPNEANDNLPPPTSTIRLAPRYSISASNNSNSINLNPSLPHVIKSDESNLSQTQSKAPKSNNNNQSSPYNNQTSTIVSTNTSTNNANDTNANNTSNNNNVQYVNNNSTKNPSKESINKRSKPSVSVRRPFFFYSYSASKKKTILNTNKLNNNNNQESDNVNSNGIEGSNTTTTTGRTRKSSNSSGFWSFHTASSVPNNASSPTNYSKNSPSNNDAVISSSSSPQSLAPFPTTTEGSKKKSKSISSNSSSTNNHNHNRSSICTIQ